MNRRDLELLREWHIRKAEEVLSLIKRMEHAEHKGRRLNKLSKKIGPMAPCNRAPVPEAFLKAFED